MAKANHFRFRHDKGFKYYADYFTRVLFNLRSLKDRLLILIIAHYIVRGSDIQTRRSATLVKHARLQKMKVDASDQVI